MTRDPFEIAGLREGYKAGRFTPVDIAKEALRRIAAYDDPAVWISKVAASDVMARAQALAKDRHGLERRPLYGIPFAVKDNIDCAEMPTTAACPDFAYRAKSDAFAVARLIDAGAILLGKTNLDQFATGLVGTRSPYGVPHCVFDSRYVSGGSSSGSAIAVAAGLVSFSLGTDTAGSGRVPAAYNNIVGLKPTRGLISTTGVVPACRSLDCVSVFAGSVSDADSVLRIVQGFDGEDAYSRPPSYNPLATADFRFGVIGATHREFFGDLEMAGLYDSAITRAIAIGGTPVEIDYAPFHEAGALLYDGPWIAERYAALKNFLDDNSDGMDPTVYAIISRASTHSAAAAFEGEYRRAALKREVEKVWKRIDVLLLPTVPTHDTIAEVLASPFACNARLGTYTNFVNLLDCCAIAVPAFFRDNGLPFGVTLVAPAFSDSSLAVLADRFHRRGNTGSGLARDRLQPAKSDLGRSEPDEDLVPLFVVGAHLKGMPLNHQLTDLGATFVSECRTKGDYRLYALPQSIPPKPGMVRSPGFHGAGILGEVWSLAPGAFGAFVAKVPAPLGIGKIELVDGSSVSGFLCESHAIANALEITDLAGWRGFVARGKAAELLE